MKKITIKGKINTIPGNLAQKRKPIRINESNTYLFNLFCKMKKNAPINIKIKNDSENPIDAL